MLTLFKVVFEMMITALSKHLTGLLLQHALLSVCTRDVQSVYSVHNSYLSSQHKASSYLVFVSTLCPISKAKQDGSSCHLFGRSRQMFCLSDSCRDKKGLTKTQGLEEAGRKTELSITETLRCRTKCTNASLVSSEHLSLYQNIHIINTLPTKLSRK